MSGRKVPLRLSSIIMAASFFLAPLSSMAAGMIVIDPVAGGMPMPTSMRVGIGRPHQSTPPRRPVPILRGAVSFGLRLQAADVKVDIKDQVARTYITQTFVNDTDRNLAGTYLFPLPEDTTFSSFSLHIDGRPVEGKILEAKQARQEYEEIVRRMVDPGLLEYADYKTVRARIFPIPAHGSKKVELEYTQLLRADNGLMHYRFPLKMEGNSAADTVKVDVKLASTQGLRTIWSPSHTIDVKRNDDHQAKVAYLGRDLVPDKDFSLYYSISDKDMTASVLSHKDTAEDGYYLLCLNPPVDSKKANPKDIVLVADTSGSMAGDRMAQNKKALKYLVNALNPDDKFNIVQFNSDVDHFKKLLVPATPASKQAALAYIEELEAHGGTNIGDALRSAGTMLDAAQNANRPGYLVLMTDGEPTVGTTSIDGLLKSVHTKRDIRLFDFGVGYEVNTRLLNKLAEAHHGTSQYVEPQENMETALASFYNKIKSPVLTNASLNYDGVQVKNTYPREVKDIFAGSQILLIGRYKNGGKGTVKLSGLLNGVQKTYAFPIALAREEVDNTYLPRIWAMRRIGYLTDVAQENGNNQEVVSEIIDLSKKYGIISQYTSFLVKEPAGIASNIASSDGEAEFLVEHRSRRQAASRGTGAFQSLLGPAPSLPRPAMPQSSMSHYVHTKPMAVRKSEAAPGSFMASSGGQGASVSYAVPGSFDAVVGKDAVLGAKFRTSLKASEKVQDKSDTNIKHVDDKTFYLRDGVWTDSAYNGSLKPVNVEFGSAAYFDLMRTSPGIGKYLSIGQSVILVFKGKCFRITPKS